MSMKFALTSGEVQNWGVTSSRRVSAACNQAGSGASEARLGSRADCLEQLHCQPPSAGYPHQAQQPEATACQGTLSTSSPICLPLHCRGMPARLMATTAAWKRLAKAESRMLLPTRLEPARARGQPCLVSSPVCISAGCWGPTTVPPKAGCRRLAG